MSPAASGYPTAARDPRARRKADGQGEDTSRLHERRAAVPSDTDAAPPRAGLLALLAEADGLEAQLHGREEPGVSTGSEDFDRLMEGLMFGAVPSSATSAAIAVDAVPEPGGLPQRPAGRRIPEPLGGPGDLVVVVGLAGDAAWAAGTLAGPGIRIHRADGETPTAAHGSSLPRIRGRVALVQARAAGVAAGEPVFVAFGLDHADELESQIQAIEALAPDQLWATVDAGRKSEDTRAWVEALDAASPVDAVAVFGTGTTATPETVAGLGIPVRDIDAGPKPRTGLRSAGTR